MLFLPSQKKVSLLSLSKSIPKGEINLKGVFGEVSERKEEMGLSNFPSAAEGVLPVLVMNTVMSVAILKNLLRSVLQFIGATAWISSNFGENPSSVEFCPPNSPSRRRGITNAQFQKLCKKEEEYANDALGEGRRVKCCVCLSKFGDEQEVSVLTCKHFFHRNCLDKWLANHHSTCPLCRSIC